MESVRGAIQLLHADEAVHGVAIPNPGKAATRGGDQDVQQEMWSHGLHEDAGASSQRSEV